jgi:1-acyl-sn-glycerol-3-phosphate acyltransferase
MENIGGGAAFLRGFSKTVVWCFFRDITVEGLGQFPMDRPVLIGSTHSNMVVDPGLVIATCPRYVAF